MSNPPQDPNHPQDPDQRPDGSGQDQPSGGPPPADRPQYNQPQYGEHAPSYGQPRPGPSVAGSQPPLEHQNPTGGPQSPYGYQSAQPSGYGYPGGQAQFQQPGPATPPKEVNIAFWLIIGAAIMTAISTIVGLVSFGSPAMMEQFESMMAQQGEDAPPIDAAAMVSVIRALTVVLALIGIGIYLLIAFMVRKGKNWARITATVLAALSLLLLIGAGALTWITVLLGVAAVVLLYMGPSSNYFNAVKARKLSGQGR